MRDILDEIDNTMINTSHSKIIPYQSDWPVKFQAEKGVLQKIFGDKLLAEVGLPPADSRLLPELFVFEINT